MVIQAYILLLFQAWSYTYVENLFLGLRHIFWKTFKNETPKKGLILKVLLFVSEAKGRLFKNTQGRYFIYLPKTLAEDSLFPFPLKPDSKMHVKLSFSHAKKQVLVKKWSADSDKTH
jgi:hypothetical protein